MEQWKDIQFSFGRYVCAQKTHNLWIWNDSIEKLFFAFAHTSEAFWNFEEKKELFEILKEVKIFGKFSELVSKLFKILKKGKSFNKFFKTLKKGKSFSKFQSFLVVS